MSSQFDSPTADIPVKCWHCGVVFLTRYPDTRYCSPQHKDAAAKKRKRARGAAKLKGFAPDERPLVVEPTIIKHPTAKDAFRRNLEARLKTPYHQFCVTFGKEHGRPPLDHEVPPDILATANPDEPESVEHRESMEEALRNLGFTSGG